MQGCNKDRRLVDILGLTRTSVVAIYRRDEQTTSPLGLLVAKIDSHLNMYFQQISQLVEWGTHTHTERVIHNALKHVRRRRRWRLTWSNAVVSDGCASIKRTQTI